MALLTKRVWIDGSKVSSALIPSGHSVSTSAASLGTVDLVETVDFTIDAADFVAATKVAGFNDLLNTELVADIDAYITAVNPGFGINTTANTVSYNARVTGIKEADASHIYLGSLAGQRQVIVTVELSVYNS